MLKAVVYVFYHACTILLPIFNFQLGKHLNLDNNTSLEEFYSSRGVCFLIAIFGFELAAFVVDIKDIAPWTKVVLYVLSSVYYWEVPFVFSLLILFEASTSRQMHMAGLLIQNQHSVLRVQWKPSERVAIGLRERFNKKNLGLYKKPLDLFTENNVH